MNISLYVYKIDISGIGLQLLISIPTINCTRLSENVKTCYNSSTKQIYQSDKNKAEYTTAYDKK